MAGSPVVIVINNLCTYSVCISVCISVLIVLEWLFILISNGNVIKYDTNTNPSNEIGKWTSTNKNGKAMVL